MRIVRNFTYAVLAASLLLAPPARATAGPSPSDGSVVMYATLNAPALAKLADAFMAAHPEIHLETLQIGSGTLPARIAVEERAGGSADVVECDEIAFAQVQSLGGVQPYRSPESAAFIPEAVDPAGNWTSLWLDTTVIAYNPERLKADHLPVPTSSADFAEPRWHGKFGLNGGALNWYLSLVQGRADGDAVASKIAANAPTIVTSHVGAVTQMEVGEYDATPTSYGYYVAEQRAKKRPVGFTIPNPLSVTNNPVGMLAHARHPQAAHVLIDWLLSRDGQAVVTKTLKHISPRKGVANDPEIWNPAWPHAFVRVPPDAELRAATQRFRTLFAIGR